MNYSAKEEAEGKCSNRWCAKRVGYDQHSAPAAATPGPWLQSEPQAAPPMGRWSQQRPARPSLLGAELGHLPPHGHLEASELGLAEQESKL